MCLDFARAEIPSDVLTLLKMGRVTALRKPNGKIRGIVIGDIMRRLVARTIAQQVVLRSRRGNSTIPVRFVHERGRRVRCTRHTVID